MRGYWVLLHDSITDIESYSALWELSAYSNRNLWSLKNSTNYAIRRKVDYTVFLRVTQRKSKANQT
jgi:hypothetical protein